MRGQGAVGIAFVALIVSACGVAQNRNGAPADHFQPAPPIEAIDEPAANRFFPPEDLKIRGKQGEQARRLDVIAHRAEAYVGEMDFRFLFDPRRKLFAIGWQETDASLDNLHKMCLKMMFETVEELQLPADYGVKWLQRAPAQP